MNHEIFKAPYSVDIELVERPNPGYGPRFPGDTVPPDTLPMWRVQTAGDFDKPSKDYEIFGLVARGGGFADSPDAEIISGGVNTKLMDGVAIGRHGNFFHWGFSASPTYMTSDAKLVFLNAAHYITKFDGQAPIARKVEGSILRDLLPKRLATLDAGHYGENFSSLKIYFPKGEWAEQGKTAEGISRFLHANGPYLYRSGRYELTLDAELKSLGLANDARDFPARMASLLQSPESAPLAAMLLGRYTLESFERGAQWQAWLEEHSKTLFFSESAGYKWIPSAGSPPISRGLGFPLTASHKITSTPSQSQPLAWVPTLTKLENGQQRLNVKVDVLAGWHAYDKVPTGQPYSPLTVSLQLPDGVQLDGEWSRPPSHPDPKIKGLSTWTTSLSFTAVLDVDDEDTDNIVCELSYQVCDDQMCLPVKTETREIRLRK